MTNKKFKFSFLCVLLSFGHLLFLEASPVLAQDNQETEKISKEYTLEDLPEVKIPETPKLDFEGEYQIWLNKGDIAPYNGVHLNPEAIAHILADYLAQKEQADIALKKQRELDLSILQLETKELKLNDETVQKKNQIKSDGQEREIKRLESINKDLQKDQSDFWRDVLLVGGGLGIGTLVGILIGIIGR